MVAPSAAVAVLLAAGWGLHWVRAPGAEECIDGRALALKVEERLGRTAFVSPAKAELVIEGSVQRDDSGFIAHVTLRDEQGQSLGTREHHVTSEQGCAALDDAVALIVALFVDPNALLRPPKPSPPPPPPSAEPPPVPAPVSVAAVPPAPPRPPDFTLRTTIWPLFGAGQLPDPTGGVRVDLFGELDTGWALSLGFEGWMPVTHLTAPFAVRLGAVGIPVGVCRAVVRRARLHLAVCAALTAGALIAQGSGFDQNLTQAAGLIDIGGRVRAGVLLTPNVEVGLVVSVLGRALQPQVVFSDASGAQTALISTHPATFDAGLGLTWRWEK